MASISNCIPNAIEKSSDFFSFQSRPGSTYSTLRCYYVHCLGKIIWTFSLLPKFAYLSYKLTWLYQWFLSAGHNSKFDCDLIKNYWMGRYRTNKVSIYILTLVLSLHQLIWSMRDTARMRLKQSKGWFPKNLSTHLRLDRGDWTASRYH